jgi:hypothetical protein
MSTLLQNDLIFYKNSDGDIMSGGYNVESHMLQNGISPMKTLNLFQQGGKDDKISSNFENMAVPAGLYYITQQNPNSKNKKYKQQMNYSKEHKELPDTIFDSLYQMIEYDDKKKRKTKKHVVKNDTTVKPTNKHKKTKKYQK